MDMNAYLAECRTEIDAIARNLNFWSKHISTLEQNGVQPSPADVDWVKKHIDGLNSSRDWFENHIGEIEKGQDAQRT